MKDYFQSAEKENLSREAYSKRFNLLVHGLEEQSDSAWEKPETTENILRKFLAEELKIDHSNQCCQRVTFQKHQIFHEATSDSMQKHHIEHFSF